MADETQSYEEQVNEFINEVVEDVLKDVEFKGDDPLIDPEREREKLRLEITDRLKEEVAQTDKAWEVLLSEVAEVDPNLASEAIEKLEHFQDQDLGFDPFEMGAFDVFWADLKEPYYVVMGLPDRVMDEFYQAGKRVFDREDFVTSAHIFSILTTLNPLPYQYWLYHGLSAQKTESHSTALESYFIADKLNFDHYPYHHCYAAECWQVLDNEAKAKESAKEGLDLCGDDPRYKDLKSFCERICRAK